MVSSCYCLPDFPLSTPCTMFSPSQASLAEEIQICLALGQVRIMTHVQHLCVPQAADCNTSETVISSKYYSFPSLCSSHIQLFGLGFYISGSNQWPEFPLCISFSCISLSTSPVSSSAAATASGNSILSCLDKFLQELPHCIFIPQV